ncbi:response regulator [Bacteriovorax sp. DB6_IX]|uniref:response regulator n=1 Tax=Bacteriovorax sp. DB6_IX TaxID=1353530 RepID=UPI000389F5EF|nr:response regulator [Bacteriovorax sp. DB6_IX]EQC51325.1 response regulator receiver domain protein [Bacteriovorax sp. DB6_IX]
MKFLFVEDETELLELYQILLEDMDINFELASNGEEALKKLENENYDFVFSDIRMPKMDGFELLSNILQKQLKIKRFVFITAHVDISKEEVEEKGAQDILYKPLGHKHLKSYIQDIMQATTA